MKILLVDDEPLALDVLSVYVEECDNLGLEIIGTASNAMDASKILQEKEVDLMFLDIKMPQMSGTDFLRILPDPPLTIVTTAFSEFALEGYELNLVDFLLKPFSKDRFIKAVEKAQEIIDYQTQGDTADFIFIKSDKKYLKVFYSDIYYIEGLKDYVIIRTKDRKLISLQTMKGLEEKLKNQNFSRVHRSYIVNESKIQSIIGNSLEMTINGDRNTIPIGKSYRTNIQSLIDNNIL